MAIIYEYEIGEADSYIKMIPSRCDTGGIDTTIQKNRNGDPICYPNERK
jgi:hypothetical protein